MAVLETGTEEVEGTDGTQQPSPYFIGGLLEGDEPQNGEPAGFRAGNEPDGPFAQRGALPERFRTKRRPTWT